MTFNHVVDHIFIFSSKAVAFGANEAYVKPTEVTVSRKMTHPSFSLVDLYNIARPSQRQLSFCDFTCYHPRMRRGIGFGRV